MAKTKVTLGEFGPDKLFFTSVGSPAGVEVNFRTDPETGEELDAGDAEGMLPEGFWSLEGTPDADGIWRWDGHGDPTDWNQNTVLRVDAWQES